MDLKLEQEKSKTTIDNLYLNLELISYEKVQTIDENIDIKEINKASINEEARQNHPKSTNFE